MNAIKRYYGITGDNTTINRTTRRFNSFLTMAYIIFVNPNVLADAGMDKARSVATCLAAIGCFIMGIYETASRASSGHGS